MPPTACAWELWDQSRPPGGLSRHTSVGMPTVFEAFHRHEFVAASAPAKIRTLPTPLPALQTPLDEEEMAASRPRVQELPPEEMPKVRTIDEEDDLRFKDSEEDPQIARLGTTSHGDVCVCVCIVCV
ncbi:unnamed protein product [Symbiodinium sp. CCMP2592]|nr:unnamed protein product [Symbiodinium sp. CCMP2592]